MASLAERGLLWTMLNQIWVSDSLPCESSELAKLLGLREQVVSEAKTNRVMSVFVLGPDERLRCPELQDLKSEYVARHSNRSAAGRKGAKRRWDKGKQAMAEPSVVAMTTPEMKRAEQSGAELKPLRNGTYLSKENQAQEIKEYKRAFGE